MVGFLVVLLFPPTVGLVTYAILRLFWNRSALTTIGPPRRRKPNSSGIFVDAEKRLRIIRRDIVERFGEWDRRRKSNSSGIFVGAEKRLRIMGRNIAEGLAEWDRRRKSNSSGIFVGAEKRLRNMRCNIAEGLAEWDGLSLSSRDRTILLLVLGVTCGFVFGWYLPSY
jgi:hypothetical protein